MAFKIADGYVDIHGRVDRRDVRRAARRAGEQAGGYFSDGWAAALGRNTSKVRSAMKRLLPMNILTFAPMAVAAAAAIGKLSAQVVGLTGHLAAALPAAGALIPVLGGLGTAVLAMVLAWKKSDVMTDVLDKIARIIRRETVPAVDALARVIGSQMPAIRGHFEKVGDAMQGMVARLAEGFDSRGLDVKLDGLFDAMAVSANHLGQIMSDLVEIIITIGNAAGDTAQRFTGFIGDTIERWRDFLNLKAETGELADFFDRAGDRMAVWGAIFGNTIGALAGMLAAAAGPGARFAESLRRITAAWEEWAWNEGHGRIRDFLTWLGGLDVGHIFQVAASITAIGLALKTLTGLMNMVAGFGLLAQMGPVALTIGAIATAIGLLAGAFTWAYTQSEAFRGAVKELWAFLAETFGPVLSTFAAAFREQFMAAMETAAAVIRDDLIPAIQRFMEHLEATLAPIGGVEGAARLLGQVLGWVAGTAMVKLINAAVRVIDTINRFRSAASTASNVVQGAWRAMVAAWQGFTSAFVAGVAITIAAVQRFISFISDLIGKIRNIPPRAKTSYDFFPHGALGIIGSIARAIESIPRVWSTVHTTYRRTVGGGGGGGSFRTGGIKGGIDAARAGGARSGLSLVGEEGPELVRMPAGSTVYPHGQSKRMAGRGGLAGPAEIVLRIEAGGSMVDRLLVEVLRDAIQVRGGDVQTVLGTA